MNQCTFIGNLVANAAQKAASGKTFITFTLAVSRKYKDKESTLFIECIKNGDNANLLPYLQKGKKIAVSGRIGCHAYMDRQKQPRASLDLSVFDLELIGGQQTQQPTQQQLAQTANNPFPPTQQAPLDTIVNGAMGNDGLPF